MLKKASRFPFQTLTCQNIESFPIPGSFDAIVLVGVLDFIKNPGLLLLELRRLLPRGGCVGMTLPESGDLNHFSSDQVNHLVKKGGFHIMKKDKFFGYKDSKSGEVVNYHGYLIHC